MSVEILPITPKELECFLVKLEDSCRRPSLRPLKERCQDQWFGMGAFERGKLIAVATVGRAGFRNEGRILEFVAMNPVVRDQLLEVVKRVWGVMARNSILEGEAAYSAELDFIASQNTTP